MRLYTCVICFDVRRLRLWSSCDIQCDWGCRWCSHLRQSACRSRSEFVGAVQRCLPHRPNECGLARRLSRRVAGCWAAVLLSSRVAPAAINSAPCVRTARARTVALTINRQAPYTCQPPAAALRSIFWQVAFRRVHWWARRQGRSFRDHQRVQLSFHQGGR